MRGEKTEKNGHRLGLRIMAIGKFSVLRNPRILAVCFFACTKLLALPEQASWHDSNGCIFCINGKVSSGICKHYSYGTKRNWQNTFFNLENKSGVYKLLFGYRTTLQVFCKNASKYCKTINDSLVIKSLPDVKERKHYCKNMDNNAKFFSGLEYSLPIEEKIQLGDISILCDFVHFDFDSQILNFKDKGICPIWVKINPYETDLYQLEISKLGKKYNAKLKKNLKRSSDGDMLYSNDFVSISECRNSNCEMLNYVEKQPQDFNINCDFIKKKNGQIGKVQVLGEGVCPIKITDKDDKKQIFYVRSIKDSNGYKLLMTNKRK